VQQDIDTVLAQHIENGPGDIRVLAAKELGAALDDRHPAAETAEHLPKLEPNVASAEDQQVLGHLIQFHD
jgi:hypothetical protein